MMMNKLNDYDLALLIANKVKEIGGNVYFVGGYVRDKLLGIENKDIDIEVHGITPKQIKKSINDNEWISSKKAEEKSYAMTDFATRQAAESSVSYATKVQDVPSEINTAERIEELKKMMKKAAKEFDFITAASLRDEILRLEAMKP